jgi:hypothetical protein
MRRPLLILGILVLGAVMLAPAIAYLGLDPVPGDFTLRQGNWHVVVPVTYSLCASLSLALLYYLAKR